MNMDLVRKAGFLTGTYDNSGIPFVHPVSPINCAVEAKRLIELTRWDTLEADIRSGFILWAQSPEWWEGVVKKFPQSYWSAPSSQEDYQRALKNALKEIFKTLDSSLITKE